MHARLVSLVSLACIGACSVGPEFPRSRNDAAAPISVSAPRSDTPTSYFPADYEGEMFFDVGAMRDNGLLDRLERLPMMGEFLESATSSYGGALDHLRRSRTALVFDGMGGRVTNRSVTVVEFEGLDRPVEMPESWQEVRLGPFAGWQLDDGRTSKMTVFWPRDGIAVVGGHDLIEPIFEGTARGGVPHGDLIPLIAGRGVLAQYVCGRFGRPISAPMLGIGFPGGLDDESDTIDCFRVRLEELEDGDLVASATARFSAGTVGIEKFEGAIRSGLQSLLDNKDLAVFKSLLSSIEIERDGIDLTVRLPLGTPRDAVAKIERAVIAVMRMTMDDR